MQSTRSYLYVEDVAEAFEVILRKGTVGETYNIGTQKERTVMDVAHSIAKHFNLPMDNIVHVRTAPSTTRGAPCAPSACPHSACDVMLWKASALWRSYCVPVSELRRKYCAGDLGTRHAMESD